MTATSTHEIKEALIDLIEGMKTPDTSRMIACMERLDALIARAAPGLDPRLRHFLERRSYAKALALLSGDAPSAPSGSCSSAPA